jgi:hypothetical protein
MDQLQTPLLVQKQCPGFHSPYISSSLGEKSTPETGSEMQEQVGVRRLQLSASRTLGQKGPHLSH